MTLIKRQAWHGLLALVCILTSIISILPLPVIQGRAYAAGSPDLTVDAITWSPDPPNIGEMTGFTVTIKNQGDASADSSRIAFFIDDDYSDFATIPAIDAGKTCSYTFNWRAKGGDHIVKAIADSDQTVAESNENNNEKTYAFSVLAPDLIIDSITWSPDKPSIGQQMTFFVTVKNTGNKKAGLSWVDFLIDGASRGQREGQALDPGANYTISYPWIAQPAQHILQASADVLNQVVESNESNNDLTKIYCTTPPDLTVDSITYAPTDRTETSNVTMLVTVKNQGEGAAPGSWLSYYIDDKFITSVYIDTLAPGATATGNYTWQAGPDSHVFKAVIDADDIIFESDESNNTKSITIPALGLPDLVIQNITWTPTTPMINSRITFTVTIANNGAQTSSKCNLSLYVSGGYKLTKQVDPIGPGSTLVVSLPWITNELSMNIRGVIDEENVVPESNKLNNEFDTSLTPGQPVATADLTVVSINCTPTVPGQGDVVSIDVTIENTGTGTATGSDIACYVDDSLLGYMYFTDLNAGETTDRSISWKATSGEHRFKAVIDPDNIVFETDKSNNEMTVPITVTAPDLAIENIEWFPVNPLVGNDVEFTVTIINQGDRASTPCYITYYIDGVQRGSHYVDGIDAGGSVTRTFTWNMQSPSAVFKAVIDEANTVIESDETNNEKSVNLPAPDLTINSITCSDDYPIANQAMTFTVAVSNTGKGNTNSVHIAGFVDGINIGTLDTGDISAGQTVNSVFTWIAVPGKHTLHFVVDPENAVTETNEDNNSKDAIIFVPLPSNQPASSDNTSVSADTITDNTTILTNAPAAAATITPTTTSIKPEDLIKDATNETLPDISGNLSATPTNTAGGIKGILLNKWLLIGVAAIGIGAIGVLLILRRRSSPKKEKQPKPPKPPKAEKPAKGKEDKKAKPQVKPAAKPVQAGDTLSGKPPVLVPPPPKPTAAGLKPGIMPPVKAIVPPANPGAGQNLGATLIKQSSQQPPQGTPPQQKAL